MSSTGPVNLTVAGLRVAYRPDVPVVEEVDLCVTANTLTALLGPSGCGKTTLLKAIAGLLVPASGDIRIGATSVLHLPAERRPVGLVFQKPLLFGHLSVGDNVAFGLRMRGIAKGARWKRALEMLDLVGLPDLARRSVGELPVGRSNGLHWPARWSWIRRSCSWTNRSRSLTPICEHECAHSCVRCSRNSRSRRCSSPMTNRRPSKWPTRSP
ncbi:MAG: ABC transporter ATP-binding protein [Actinomycetota bacterium]|nr:ABC transporter ATP-binding protein [Actinomycetota bacterium]